ncbi:MAG: SH3 domain-containing protein, partial [Gallionellaceae bacterium]|nr:SH3 domain-containing protein [Gallionellaceae bacterium]
WIEKSATSATRYVAITAEQADVRQTPADNSAIVAHVMRDVALEWLESSGDGWVKVRHEDGVTGYVKVVDVWGN